MKTTKIVFSAVMLIFCTNSINASIHEGIDTTDSEGFGLDSLFRIQVSIIPIKFRDSIIEYRGDTSISFSGQVIAHYAFDPGWCCGYFNLHFDEICLAPDTVLSTYINPQYFHNCFVLKNPTNNTYSKLQVLKRLSGNRFAYHYLINDISGQRILINTGTSPGSLAQLKKVNNVNFTGYKYRVDPTDSIHTAYLSWDPPAITQTNPSINPSNISYILYRSKDNIQIDTTKPVDRSQWVPVKSFSNSPQYVDQFPRDGYVNMVSVISGDTSEFLSGWTWCNYDVISIWENNLSRHKNPVEMIVNSSPGSTIITLLSDQDKNERGLLSIFNLKGMKISTLLFTGKPLCINKEQLGFCNGGYILRATFPGKETLTARVMQTR